MSATGKTTTKTERMSDMLQTGRVRSATLLLLSIGLVAGDVAGEPAAAERGEYLAAAGGCMSCHTDSDNDGEPYAGGHPLETPYGVFYAPNITPDPVTGIGNWTGAQFIHALKHGVSPAGEYYYPAFPYASYAGMTDEDALDIKAYLDTLPAVEQPAKANELAWYVPGRWAMGIWQWLFAPWRYAAAPSQATAEWRRGAYLVRHLGHCGECHTPRDRFGALDTRHELAGVSGANQDKPVNDTDGGVKTAPNITPDKDHGIGSWSAGELEFFLELGMLPDGDFVGGNMVAVVDDNTALLTEADRRAITVFLRSLSSEAGE